MYYTHAEGSGIAVAQFFASALDCEINGIPVKLSQRIDTLTGMEKLSGSVTGIQAVNKVCNANPHNPDILKTILSVSAEKPAAFELKIRIPCSRSVHGLKKE
ncbi:MAG: hypothetical protein LBG22_00715 [Treponema sp.]|nr:hypothetical protein [Treponema sp.]